MQMTRRLIPTILLLLVFSAASARQLQTAETAYRKKQYAATLQALQTAENKGQKTGEYGQYLRIMSQRALLPAADSPGFYQDIKQFDQLETLRDNCRAYLILKTPGKIPQQRRRQILAVQESLQEYPVAKVQFDENMHLRKSKPY